MSALVFLIACVGFQGAAAKPTQPQAPSDPGKPGTKAAAKAVGKSAAPIVVPDKGPKRYICHRRVGTVVVDGKVNEDAWNLVPWSDYFVDIEGDVRPRPRFLTRMKMLWDDEYFYFAADLQEPHVWGTLTQHDAVIFQDNDFEIFIDPDGDNHQYYEIEINALNTEWDLFLDKPYRDGGPARNEWEIPGLLKGVHVNGTLNDPKDVDGGWTVEIAIPWKVLGEFANRPVPPAEGDQWRVNFSRVEWRHEIVDGKYRKVPNNKEDNWVWSPQGVVDMHRPEKWGYVQFTKLEPGRVRPQPDLTAPGRDRLHQVYYAQKAHKAKTGAYAKSLEELGLSSKELPPTMLRTTPDGFEAMVVVPKGLDSILPLTIRADSKIIVGEPQPSPSVNID
ncbi:MAG: carbohydrate-binding family 9-like protein [Isosphaeraceae bacterium]|nr:carbohydrate-binding family 9-like protein [Isosphaeraceae bacterium]